MKLFVDFWKLTKIWKDLHHRNTELFLFWSFDAQNNFMFPTSKNIQKWVKINRQTFVIWWPNATGIDLFDIYLAVGRSEILHILKKPNGLWFFCEVLIFANSMSSFLKSLLSLWSMFHQNNSDCWRFLEFWIVKILIS